MFKGLKDIFRQIYPDMRLKANPTTKQWVKEILKKLGQNMLYTDYALN